MRFWIILLLTAVLFAVSPAPAEAIGPQDDPTLVVNPPAKNITHRRALRRSVPIYADADNDGVGAGNPIGEIWVGSPVPAMTSVKNTDCNDGNSFVFQAMNVVWDGDSDHFRSTEESVQCVGERVYMPSTKSGCPNLERFNDIQDGYRWVSVYTTFGVDPDDTNPNVPGLPAVCLK